LRGDPEIAEIIARTSPNSNIIEIGASTGEFLYELRKNGRCFLTGVDINSEIAKIARDRYNLNFLVGQLEKLSLPERSFDMVIMRHVLEHLARPSASYENSRRYPETWRILHYYRP
jgi:ubiquinone/menaquinone biosynthesis C-methylase UbiE